MRRSVIVLACIAAPVEADKPVIAGGRFYCTRLHAPGFQQTACEKSEAACTASAAKWRAEVGAKPSRCVRVPRAVCYVSKVEGEAPITSCHQTLADCAKTRAHESEHNRDGPVLSKCTTRT